MNQSQLLRRLSLALLLAIAATSLSTAAEPVSYELRFDPPNTHLLSITVRADDLHAPSVELALPAWSPGAYVINEYAKMVQDFSASRPDGQPLAWRKTDAQTWQIELAGSTGMVVHYKLFGNALANNWVQYNEQHAHIAGPATWMYLVNGKDRPVRLTIQVPTGWRIATGMTPAGINTYTAADYDWFADSPIEISDFAEKTFTVSGTTYHVIVHDVLGRSDFNEFTQDMQRIVETTVPMYATVVGGAQAAPFTQYWFLFHIWPRSGGGLEHLNSTQINFSSSWSSRRPAGLHGTDYTLKLFVTTHEFYHAWNVKRLRPRPLGPFDYSQEVHTPSLWISEGLTSYYGDLALVRAGLVNPEDYLQEISQLITRFEEEPGRAERSIEQSSWDTWFHSSPRTEDNLANTTYSYYDGGQIVGHLLDFAIRQATGNRKSLDDWMRVMYQRYALPKPGFEPEDAVRAASEVAGKDLSDFFRRYISGKEPLPYETYFGYAGIEVEKHLSPEKPWLGVATDRNDDGRAHISNLIPGSPAEKAGLDRDDVVVAVDGRAVDQQEFLSAVTARRAGETLKITVIRAGELREILAPLGSDPYYTFTLRPVQHPTDLQRHIYRSWLGLR